MLSATDVITYIGVPLAVLGVLPILYTFASALYTRNKIQRNLRKNGLQEVPIRTRLMTGVVEVDLPNYTLQPPERDDKLYWSNAKPKSDAVGSPSWTQLNWSWRKTGNSTVRLQRTDRIKLPKAKIDFRTLLIYLQDRGACPCSVGFRMLRERGLYTTVGTVLIRLLADGKVEGSRVLAIEPSDLHDSISLRLISVDHTVERMPSHSYLVGPLGEGPQRAVLDFVDPAPSVARRRNFVIGIGPNGARYVGIRSEPAPALDMGEALNSDHLALLSNKLQTSHGSCFACAAIAVFDQRKLYFDIHTDDRIISTTQNYAIRVWYAINLGLLDNKGIATPLVTKSAGAGGYYFISNDDQSASVRRPNPSQESSTIMANDAALGRILKYISFTFEKSPKNAMSRWRSVKLPYGKGDREMIKSNMNRTLKRPTYCFSAIAFSVLIRFVLMQLIMALHTPTAIFRIT